MRAQVDHDALGIASYLRIHGGMSAADLASRKNEPLQETIDLLRRAVKQGFVFKLRNEFFVTKRGEEELYRSGNERWGRPR